MTPNDLDAIRARAEAATDDTWKVATSDDGWAVYVSGYPGKVHVIADYLNRSDAEFIAHAREDVPALLYEVERLRRGRNIWRQRWQQLMRDHEEAVREHDRQVKAEALRVASAQCSNVAFGSNADVAEWLLDRADRIESQETP